MSKSKKLYNLVQYCVPIIAWILFLIFRPNFSFGSYLSKVYKLSTTEERTFDLAIFTLIANLLIQLLEKGWQLITFKPVHVNVYFENERDKNKDSTVLDPPEKGNPQRIRMQVEVKYGNEWICSGVKKLLETIVIECEWISDWLVVELDDLKITGKIVLTCLHNNDTFFIRCL